MGFSPREVGACSLWQFTQALEGWRRANGDSSPDAPTDNDFDAAVAELYPEAS
jgi:hypothetical protein